MSQFETYAETIDWLFTRFPSYQNVGAKAYKPTLENTRKLCAALGNPEQYLKFVHVAGTNGKGSTCNMLASILTESGYKTGLFTSPHILDFRERIRVNGQLCSEQEVVKFCHRVRDLELDFEPSFFEITFVMALVIFKTTQCDICVIETGLGGRLDATNVIIPLVSLITNISLDHMQFLGNSLESIAKEKAGIIKPEVPVVIGQTHTLTQPIFEEVAAMNNADILFADREEAYLPKHFPFIASYQRSNYLLVYQALKLLQHEGFTVEETHIDEGLNKIHQNTGFFGRLQVVQEEPLIIYDVAHNLDGIDKTLDAVSSLNKGRLHIVYATSSDKDTEAIFALFPQDALYYFTQFRSERAMKVAALKAQADNSNLKADFFENALEAYQRAQAALNEEDTLLVFGSFFLIAELIEKK